MNLKTFQAPTIGEALTQVKSTMGADAVILHTRTIHTRYCLGLRRREIVEITAGRGLNIGARPPRRAPESVPPRTQMTYSRTGIPVGAPPSNAAEGCRAILTTPAAGAAVLLSIDKQMADLQTMVQSLIKETHKRATPQVPDALYEYYAHLKENQVSEELATDLIQNVNKQIRPEHLLQPEYVLEKLAELIERLLQVSGPITRTKSAGPHVVALIGPTGVGKTTTIAKLAANLKLREKHRVGLITLDTYRIAAVDQLKRYADIIGSPLRVASGPEELRAGIAALSNCDFILIDTAGRSPNDALKLNELKGLLAAAAPDDVHLVLSTTASQECIKLAVSRFSDVRVDKLIFTKLDEAAHVGTVLNVVRTVNKRLSYITTGQDVPEDIEVGRAKRLAQLILGAGL